METLQMLIFFIAICGSTSLGVILGSHLTVNKKQSLPIENISDFIETKELTEAEYKKTIEGQWDTLINYNPILKKIKVEEVTDDKD